jgi:hypothetical protein
MRQGKGETVEELGGLAAASGVGASQKWQVEGKRRRKDTRKTSCREPRWAEAVPKKGTRSNMEEIAIRRIALIYDERTDIVGEG